MTNKPIGIFDSGVGGLSVWKEVASLLPAESICYLADSKHCPYGSKSKKEIIGHSKHVVDFLISRGSKLIVVACNSATAAAIDFLRKNYEVPFVGMEPAVKIAASRTATGSIGVLATELTFNGRHYNETSSTYAKGINLSIQAGHGLVDLVEAGKYNSEEAEALLRKYLGPMLSKNIDQLVLGCTHYPFLIPLIKKIIPVGVDIIDPSPAVARQVKSILEKNSMLSSDGHDNDYKFYSNGERSVLERFVREMSGKDFEILKF